MATLLLTAVGSAIAGPIGAAIGAMAGQRVDQALLGPKGRQGARLADLAVQSSSYGASIPRIYGRMRVSGTVIWATDLREERRKVSQGKGRPKATVYSYSASFAVLLSGRPAGRIGRIWADGKLLRGAAGDFKVEAGFRFHSGGSDQPVDPLIASAEGGDAPAYRGRAYAVFEDMALDSFGNRIPMLSFEVIADDRVIETADLLADLATDPVAARPAMAGFQGYVADGASFRAAIGPLEAVDPVHLRDDGTRVELGGMTGAPFLVRADDAGASPDGDAFPRLQRTRQSSATLPTRADIGFADVARDYQSGLQNMGLHLDGAMLHVDLPAALDAEAARDLASRSLFRARTEGVRAELRLPWRCLAAWQATLVRMDGFTWQIRKIRFEAMCLVLDLVAATTGSPAALPADAGRVVSEPDQPAGETQLYIADLPPMGDTAPVAPLIVAAAAGRSSAWRSAALLLRTDGQSDWQDIGSTAAPAILGTCIGVLPASSPQLFDLTNTLTVQLLHDDMALFSVDDAALLAGANAALVGEEIVQFGRAEKLGTGQWRLSRLLRGRRGTEQEGSAHGAEERFLLLDAETLLALSIPLGSQSIEVMAKGVGDRVDVRAGRDISGNAVRPLAPVHLHWEKTSAGGLRISWVRRSRDGWRWLDLVDVPLGEEFERYRFVLATAPAPLSFETTAPHIELPQSLIADMHGQGFSDVQISVVQIGRSAVSRPLFGRIPI